MCLFSFLIMLRIKKGEMSLRVIIVLFVVILMIFLIYNVKGVSDFLTGNVALTSNALNENEPNATEETITNISIGLIFVLVIGLVALLVFVNYVRKKNRVEIN